MIVWRCCPPKAFLNCTLYPRKTPKTFSFEIAFQRARTVVALIFVMVKPGVVLGNEAIKNNKKERHGKCKPKKLLKSQYKVIKQKNSLYNTWGSMANILGPMVQRKF